MRSVKTLSAHTCLEWNFDFKKIATFAIVVFFVISESHISNFGIMGLLHYITNNYAVINLEWQFHYVEI